MTAAFQYRPRFVDIRVRPPKPDPLAAEGEARLQPDERPCDHQGCRQAATARAPKSRDMLNEHYWFCQAHAAEYNRTWNFFAGMTDDQIRARQTEDASTGGRPTWSFKAGRGSREAAAAASKGFFRDAFGIFGRGQAQYAADKAAHEKQLGRLERNALADLDLDATADAALIRRRYTELLKRCHPDANGGDRSAEHKLQRVIKAFRTLQKAKLV
ncbi:MAG TPA: DnaJ domain-containing protein [Caulobacteraceae bacterium]|nr:DnaJ domain-containing protein [Caulobacteraceae bacterium]